MGVRAVTPRRTATLSQRGSPGFQSIELRFPRELAATHIGGVTFHGLRHDIAQIAVATDEFWCPVEQPDHIVGDEDLAVAFRRRADSDGRHRDLLRDLFREVGRSEEHTSELQSLRHLVCRLLLEKKKNKSSPSLRLLQYEG